MTAQAYSAAELVAFGFSFLPTTERRVREKALRESWPSRPRAGRGGGREYLFSGLPAELQDALFTASIRSAIDMTPSNHQPEVLSSLSSGSPSPEGVSPAVAAPQSAAVGGFSSMSKGAKADQAVSALPAIIQAGSPVVDDDLSTAEVSFSNPTRPPLGMGGEGEAVGLRASAQPTAERHPIPGLPEIQQWANERALRLSLKDLQDPKVQAKIACAQTLASCGRYRRDGGGTEATVAALAAKHQVSPQTIRRWADEVESWRVKSRLPVLRLTDQAIELPNSRAFCQEAVAAGVALYAANLKAGQKAAYQKLQATAQERNWTLGDYSTFHRLLNKIPERAWEYISKGPVGFELGNAPKIIRAWLSVPVYSVLCGDQNIPDYQVVEPSTGEIYTPNLYLWMECTSRAWVGLWPAMGPYNKYTVGYALREACRLGTPEEIFTDWGKPETSNYTAQLAAGLNGFLSLGDWSDYAGRYGERDRVDSAGQPAPTGVDHRKAQPGVPWHKPIENQMNILRRELLNRFTPAFRQRVGDAWVMKQRNQELAKARADGHLFTTEEFLELIRDIAEAHNANPCQVKEQSAKIVPAEVLVKGLREAPRTVFDPITLDLLFLPRFERRPHQSMVRVSLSKGDTRHYYAPELFKLPVGSLVQVSVDPFDTSSPAVLTTTRGEFIGQAEPWTVQASGDDAGLQHKLRRQNELMRWWRKEVERIRSGWDIASIPRIAAATKVAKAAAEQQAAKPSQAAAARADAKLIQLYGGR